MSPRTVWKPHPHPLIVDRLGLMRPARCESCPSGQRRGPAAPGEIHFHPRVRNRSLRIQLQQPGDELVIFLVDVTPHGVETPPSSLIVDWLGFMEPTRRESCPSGQRRGLAAPGED